MRERRVGSRNSFDPLALRIESKDDNNCCALSNSTISGRSVGEPSLLSAGRNHRKSAPTGQPTSGATNKIIKITKLSVVVGISSSPPPPPHRQLTQMEWLTYFHSLSLNSVVWNVESLPILDAGRQGKGARSSFNNCRKQYGFL
jgi:hypothetical protein